MGSFNVACSISKISIGPGTPVVYIPLVRPFFRSSRREGLEIPGPYLIYPNDYFSPMCLPIRCEYNDYGGIENVVRDDNVEAIEAFFGFPVEELVSHIQRRGLYDYFSDTCKRFLPMIKQLSDYSVKFDEDFLKAFNFVEIMVEDDGDEVTKVYEYADVLLSVFVTWNDRQLCITDADGKALFTLERKDENYFRQMKTTFLHTFAKLANYYIGAKKEHQEMLRLLDSMSGMFVVAEIYDTLSVDTHTSDFYGKSYAEIFDEQVETLQKLEEAKKDTSEKGVIALARQMLLTSDAYFNDYHRYWAYFKEIYNNAICNGKLREEFIAYSRFSINMHAMNCFYFPAVNGEQCGNHKASLVLAKKTVEILEAKIKEYEDDEFFDEEDDEES